MKIYYFFKTEIEEKSDFSRIIRDTLFNFNLI